MIELSLLTTSPYVPFCLVKLALLTCMVLVLGKIAVCCEVPSSKRFRLYDVIPFVIGITFANYSLLNLGE
jgi:hypothetical protein